MKAVWLWGRNWKKINLEVKFRLFLTANFIVEGKKGRFDENIYGGNFRNYSRVWNEREDGNYFQVGLISKSGLIYWT